MGRNPLKVSLDVIKTGSNEIQTAYSASASRMLHLAGLTGVGSIFLGLSKIISGILASSVFTCVNGFYTLGMVLARYCALAGAVRTRQIPEQYRYYRWSGMILIGASCLYIAYSVRMYFHPGYAACHPYIAMGIAAVTFAEIGLNLRGVLVFRKNRSPLLHALKTINLAASLISLVLTQAVILSFADEGQNPSANGILGALMGACAVLLGVYMLMRMRRITDPSDCRREQICAAAEQRFRFQVKGIKKERRETDMVRILVVDDEVKLTQSVCAYLNDSGYEAKGCLSADAAYEAMYNQMYDLIISDIMMPGTDGFDFVKAVRGINKTIPILFISARDDLPAKKKGFDLGIDDYMVKPVDLSELLMRVRALLRRANIEVSRKLTVGGLVLDADGLTAFSCGEEIQVTTREFNILYKLLSYPNHTFSRSQLMDEFWGVESDTGLRAVDVYITKLRDKFSSCADFEIKTVRGLGYKAVIK